MEERVQNGKKGGNNMEQLESKGQLENRKLITGPISAMFYACTLPAQTLTSVLGNFTWEATFTDTWPELSANRNFMYLWLSSQGKIWPTWWHSRLTSMYDISIMHPMSYVEYIYSKKKSWKHGLSFWFNHSWSFNLCGSLNHLKPPLRGWSVSQLWYLGLRRVCLLYVEKMHHTTYHSLHALAIVRIHVLQTCHESWATGISGILHCRLYRLWTGKILYCV